MQFTNQINPRWKLLEWVTKTHLPNQTRKEEKQENNKHIANRKQMVPSKDLNPTSEISDLRGKKGGLEEGTVPLRTMMLEMRKEGWNWNSDLGYSHWCLCCFFNLYFFLLFFWIIIIALCGPTTSGDAPSPQFFNLFSLPTRSNGPLFRHPFFIKINW